MYNREISKN